MASNDYNLPNHYGDDTPYVLRLDTEGVAILKREQTIEHGTVLREVATVFVDSFDVLVVRMKSPTNDDVQLRRLPQSDQILIEDYR